MPISIKGEIFDETWKFVYDDEEVALHVRAPRSFHSLHISNRKGFKKKHPWGIFFRIINEFVWYYGIEVTNLNGAHGDYAANANFMPNDDGYAVRIHHFQQQVFGETQHLALGFYREAVSGGSPYYAFLCYAKILEIPFKDGKAKGVWIENEIRNLRSSLALAMRDRRLHMLGDKPLGAWLKEDGRDALAHANIQSGRVVRDPNSHKDWDDIKWGNAVMSELAQKIIVEKLGVPRSSHW